MVRTCVGEFRLSFFNAHGERSMQSNTASRAAEGEEKQNKTIVVHGRHMDRLKKEAKKGLVQFLKRLGYVISDSASSILSGCTLQDCEAQPSFADFLAEEHGLHLLPIREGGGFKFTAEAEGKGFKCTTLAHLGGFLTMVISERIHLEQVVVCLQHDGNIKVLILRGRTITDDGGMTWKVSPRTRLLFERAE